MKEELLRNVTKNSVSISGEELVQGFLNQTTR
jgi:hypothetical protein